MRDLRRAPFCWQSVAALTAIRKRCEGRQRTTVLAAYATMTEVANEQRSDEFPLARATLAKRAGLSRQGLDDAAAILEELGLLRRERRDHGGRDLPTQWELLSPELGGHEIDTGGSEIAEEVVSKKARIQEVRQQGEDDQRSSSPTRESIPGYVTVLLPHLNRVRERWGAKFVDRAAVVRKCEQFSDRDLEREARRFADYWLQSDRKRRDVPRAWGEWLSRAAPMSKRAQIRAAERRQARDHRTTDPGKRALHERINRAREAAA